MSLSIIFPYVDTVLQTHQESLEMGIVYLFDYETVAVLAISRREENGHGIRSIRSLNRINYLLAV